MPSFTRNQKQLLVLGLLLIAILVVLAFYVIRLPVARRDAPYAAPTIEAKIPDDLVRRPEYRRLELRVDLPVVPGRMGRDNPFEPY